MPRNDNATPTNSQPDARKRYLRNARYWSTRVKRARTVAQRREAVRRVLDGLYGVLGRRSNDQ